MAGDDHQGATGEAYPRVLVGYLFVGGFGFFAGLYLSGWYFARNPGAIGTVGTDHLAVGLGFVALAGGMAVLESCEDYFGTTLSQWAEDHFGDDETVDLEMVDPDDYGELVAVGEDDRGERVEIYLEEGDDE